MLHEIEFCIGSDCRFYPPIRSVIRVVAANFFGSGRVDFKHFGLKFDIFWSSSHWQTLQNKVLNIFFMDKLKYIFDYWVYMCVNLYKTNNINITDITVDYIRYHCAISGSALNILGLDTFPVEVCRVGILF